jgi:DNA polymerase III delta subunit
MPKGGYKMIKTLTGKNSYALHEALQRIVHDFQKRFNNLAIERFDGQEHDAVAIKSSLTNISFLSPQKLVIVHDLSAQKELAEGLPELTEHIPDSTDLVIVEHQLDKRLAYAKFLKKHTDYQEFPELDEMGLSNWVQQAVKEAGGLIDNRAAHYLVQRSGGGQQQLFSDLQKLLLFDAAITKSSIDMLVDPAPTSTIFNLLDSAFRGDVRQALALYEDQKAQGITPQHIIAMFVWQLHGLALAAYADSPDQLSRSAHIKPFVANKNFQLARRIGKLRVRGLLGDLLQIDEKIKTSKIDAEEALLTYILGISAAND